MARKRKDDKIGLLSRVSLLSACSDKELRSIGRLMTQASFDPGAVVVREGAAGREFFLIADGTARVSVGGRKRATLGPGDFFGEMSLLDHGPRTATVEAESDLHVYVLDAREFAGLLDTSPTVARKIMAALSQRLRAAEKGHTH